MNQQPRGRDEVCAALVASATDLFARRGPAAVSLRDVAEAADVTYGLVYRHVGSKAALVQLVLDERSAAVADDIETSILAPGALAGVLGVLDRHREFWRILGWLELAGDDAASSMSGHPVLELLTAEVAGRASESGRRSAAVRPVRGVRPSSDELDAHARVRAAAVAAAALGWLLFGEYLREALDLGSASDELHQQVEDQLARLLDPEAVS